MTTNQAVIPRGRPFTADDLDAMPDDGNRHELIDGTLFVTPRPDRRHQRVLVKIAAALDKGCPAGLEMLLGPFAVRPSPTTELQPDALVARTEKAVYERMGVASYWVVDPQAPSVTVFELADGRYGRVAEVKDTEVLSMEQPFPVRLVPKELVS